MDDNDGRSKGPQRSGWICARWSARQCQGPRGLVVLWKREEDLVLPVLQASHASADGLASATGRVPRDGVGQRM